MNRPGWMLAALVLMLMPMTVQAHVDRVLHRRSDGSVAGVPQRFGPVAIDLRFPENQPPLVTLRIGPNAIRLPNCIAELIKARRVEDIELSGSWYHEQSNIPYYISVDFYAPGVKHEQMSGDYVNVLFSLHDARVLSIGELRPGWLWFGPRYRQLEPEQLCRKHELRSARLR